MELSIVSLTDMLWQHCVYDVVHFRQKKQWCHKHGWKLSHGLLKNIFITLKQGRWTHMHGRAGSAMDSILFMVTATEGTRQTWRHIRETQGSGILDSRNGKQQQQDHGNSAGWLDMTQQQTRLKHKLNWWRGWGAGGGRRTNTGEGNEKKTVEAGKGLICWQKTLKREGQVKDMQIKQGRKPHIWTAQCIWSIF